MEHVDLRKLNRGELTQIRRQVVRLKRMGKTGKEIEELTGVRQSRISEIWTAYQREGDSSLEPKKRGFQRRDTSAADTEGAGRNTRNGHNTPSTVCIGIQWPSPHRDYIKGMRCQQDSLCRRSFTPILPSHLTSAIRRVSR